jgi:hypothetical protein
LTKKGNSIVIWSIVYTKKLRESSTYLLCLNLTIADLVISTFTNGLSIVGIVIGERLGRIGPLCNFIGAVCLLGCAASLLTMGVLAINRYVNICKNNLYKKIFSINKTYIVSFLCWIGALVLDLPNLLGWGNHTFDLKTASCVWNRTARFSHTIFFSTVAVFIPCTLILLCYMKVFHYIYKHRANSMARRSSNQGQNKDDKAVKIAISLFVPFMVLVVCW